jgi:hypothetical protein
LLSQLLVFCFAIWVLTSRSLVSELRVKAIRNNAKANLRQLDLLALTKQAVNTSAVAVTAKLQAAFEAIVAQLAVPQSPIPISRELIVQGFSANILDTDFENVETQIAYQEQVGEHLRLAAEVRRSAPRSEHNDALLTQVERAYMIQNWLIIPQCRARLQLLVQQRHILHVQLVADLQQRAWSGSSDASSSKFGRQAATLAPWWSAAHDAGVILATLWHGKSSDWPAWKADPTLPFANAAPIPRNSLTNRLKDTLQRLQRWRHVCLFVCPHSFGF